MKDLWAEYEKILWRAREIENVKHDVLCTEKCRCRTATQEMADWDAYVERNYRDPLPVPKVAEYV